VSLTAADLQEIMRLVEDSTFDELLLETNGIKLHLRRGAPTPGAATGAFAPVAAAVPAPPAAAAAAADLPRSPPATTAAGTDVSSPLLGTFYRAPKPGSPPFVDVGALVEPDTIIGIVEVMKLMNTVRAGLRGRVTEILVTDGALVEFGAVLIRVAAE
jgi:acetyl-CoA carboxylase biotin carboxyl carrier protein